MDSSGSSSAPAGSTAAALLADMAAPPRKALLGDVRQAQQLVWASLSAPRRSKNARLEPERNVTDVLRLRCYL